MGARFSRLQPVGISEDYKASRTLYENAKGGSFEQEKSTCIGLSDLEPAALVRDAERVIFIDFYKVELPGGFQWKLL